MEIGKRLKDLRLRNNLTLEELASRCELSKGFLSQLERDLTSPSIQTLEDITNVLGVTLEDFFKEKKEEKYTYHRSDFFVDEKDGRKITYLIPEVSRHSVEPLELILEPGASSQEIKTHEGEEFGYVIAGRIRLEDLTNNESYLLKKGETFCLRGEFKHRLVNEGPGAAKVIWISSPSVF